MNKEKVEIQWNPRVFNERNEPSICIEHTNGIDVQRSFGTSLSKKWFVFPDACGNASREATYLAAEAWVRKQEGASEKRANDPPIEESDFQEAKPAVNSTETFFAHFDGRAATLYVHTHSRQGGGLDDIHVNDAMGNAICIVFSWPDAVAQTEKWLAVREPKSPRLVTGTDTPLDRIGFVDGADRESVTAERLKQYRDDAMRLAKLARLRLWPMGHPWPKTGMVMDALRALIDAAKEKI